MNPEKPSRKEIEAKLTALLLGELPAEEAKLLRWAIAQDAELKKLHDRLQITAGFVREVAKNPAETIPAQTAPLKLSGERREKLLAHFNTIAPGEFVPLVPPLKKRREISPLLAMAAAIVIIGILAAMLLPALSKTKSKAMRSTSQANASINNLRQMDEMKGLVPAHFLPDEAAPQAGLPARDVVTVGAVEGLVDVTTNAVSVFGNAPRQQIVLPQIQNSFAGVPGDELAVAPPPTSEFFNANLADGNSLHEQNYMGVHNADPQQATEQLRLLQNSSDNRSPVVASPPATRQTQLNYAASSFGNGGGGFGGAVAGGGRGGSGGGGAGGASHGFFLAGPVGSGDDAWQTDKPTAPTAAPAASEAPGFQFATGQLENKTLSGEVAFDDGGVQQAGDRSHFYRNIAPDSAADKKDKVPMLGDVPVAGSLFKSGSANISGYIPGAAMAGIANGAAVPVVDNSGNIWLADDLSKPGAGAVTLNGNNIYDGVTTVTAGTLHAPISAANPLGQFPGNTAGGVFAPSSDTDQLVTSGLRNSPERVPVFSTTAGAQGSPGGSAVTYNNVTLSDGAIDDALAKLRAQREQERQQAGGNLTFAGIPTATSQKIEAGTLVQDGKLLYEMGKLEESEAKLQEALKADPNNSSAYYYDQLIKQSRYDREEHKAATSSQDSLVKVETAYDSVRVAPTVLSQPAPQLVTRSFKVDPNTFYAGLQGVTMTTFGSGVKNSGGLSYITPTSDTNVAASARNYFISLGVDLSTSGKTISFDNNSGQLFVRGTEQDLDTIDRVVQAVKASAPAAIDTPLPKTPSLAPVPQPEILSRENAFSTFSLNVSDVSFKLAAASLEKGQLPDAASIRTEEFINAFNYHDPEPAAGVPVAFVSERARYPFAQNRDLLRFSIKTAAAGREAGRPLNLVLLLDNSGSMERADRVAIIHEALKVLASQFQPQDTLSVVTFARTARLWVDGARGDQAGTAVNQVSDLTPEGGTNLEEAMNLAYATARRHYLANGVNRVVLLTDGAANLGNVNPEALKQKVEAFRKQGIALDCFGIGWEGYNDDLLEQLSSNGDGRYGFINTPEAATTEFAAQLAGALHVAAEDVKVQVEFNPQRVISYRQIGYAKHQLTKEQFRDNTVAAAPMAAREAGNALYTVEINPSGTGPVATVRVRFRVPGTTDVSEHEWEVPFDGTAPALEKSSPALRLAATASAFSEWLASSPFAQEVTTDQLLNYLSGVPAIYGADARPKQLETMLREAKSLSGK